MTDYWIVGILVSTLSPTSRSTWARSALSGLTTSHRCARWWWYEETTENIRFNQVCDCDRVGCQFFRYGPSTFAQVLQLINLFGIFWGVFFMEAFGQLVLAGAFAGWYWTFKKPDNLPTNGLSASLYRSVRYHLG